MSIPKSEIKKFAKLVAEDFLEGKSVGEIQGLTQDHIDAFVIPIMTDVEDQANSMISNKIKDSFEADPLEENDEWWSSRR